MAALRRPIPIIFDLETTGESMMCMPCRRGHDSALAQPLLASHLAAVCVGIGAELGKPVTLACVHLLQPPHAGFSTRYDCVTEIAALPVNSSASSSGWSSLVQLPRGKQIAPGAQNVNGIHDALLAAEGVPFADAYQRFLGLLQRHMEGAEPGAYLLLIGHNIRSEWGLAARCSRLRPQA